SRPREAAQAYRRVLATGQKYLTDFPNGTRTRPRMVNTCNQLGDLLRNTGRLQAAEAAFRQAIEIEQQQRAAQFADEPISEVARAASYRGLGALFAAAVPLHAAKRLYPNR